MADCKKISRAFVETVSLLYIILFVYAALNKLLDFENFQVQLGQSPLLSAFAGPVSYLVPVVEFVIVVLLVLPKLRYIGLLASFCLMIMFSTYIFIMLHFSPFVPCSCGGILEKLSWNQHLLFNVIFVILALAALIYIDKSESPTILSRRKIYISVIASGALISVAVVGVLFVMSEDMIHHRNNFVRRFPHHPVNLVKELDLKFNSYYIAGIDNGKIYLGNVTAPLTLTVIDTALTKKEVAIIKLPNNSFEFKSVRLTIKAPFYYVSDGTVPCIFRGILDNWKPELWTTAAYFTAMKPLDSEIVAIRAISSGQRQTVLGTITVSDTTRVDLSKSLLTKQVDGIFDSDGTLLYNEEMQQLIYTYFYRNEIVTSDKFLVLRARFHTIDTNTQAKIKTAYIQSSKQTKMSTPPPNVNKATATSGSYLFVNAALMGKYEPKDMWDKASIIDVYNLYDGTYAFSFYMSDKLKNKMSEFAVDGNLVVSLTGTYLSTYKIKTSYYRDGS